LFTLYYNLYIFLFLQFRLLYRVLGLIKAESIRVFVFIYELMEVRKLLLVTTRAGDIGIHYNLRNIWKVMHGISSSNDEDRENHTQRRN